jgi:subtilisin-like proprotein convertase family protein
MRRMKTAGALALAASTVALIAAPAAGATTYNNDTPIVIPAGGHASPYPSSITVSGQAGPITDVNVGFDGFNHGVPTDVSIVLVAPTGQALLLVDCIGDSIADAGAFITLDDAAAVDLPFNGVIRTGTYRPTAHCATRSFGAPGPSMAYANPGPGGGGTATFASSFNGSSAIGTWNLYVVDFHVNDGGSIPGGWSLDVHPDVTPLAPAQAPAPAPKKKCKKKKGKKAASAAKGCKKKKR